jgi:hypothetical protein
MKRKDNQEDKVSMVCEPRLAYNGSASNPKVNSTSVEEPNLGTKAGRMSVEEYFDQLRTMVNEYYDNLQS